jgi:predicted enzyme related to lactoylglutathione lyase
VVDYIVVSDVDETLKKAIENGGKVTRDKFTEGDHTELAEFEFEGVVHGVLRWLKS